MKKLLLAAILTSFSGLVWSGQAIYTPGTMATTGNTSIGLHLLSVTHNPAAGQLVLKPKDNFRMGYLSSAGFALEYGDVGNFSDELNDLTDLLDDGNVTLDEANSTLTRFNNVIADLAESGYIKGSGDLSIPGFPMVFHSETLGGNVALEGEVNLQFKGSVLASNSDVCGNLLCLDVNFGTYDTKTSLYLKGAQLSRFAVGYSRPVWSSEHGKLLGGVKLQAYNMQLSKQVISLNTLDGEDVSDVIQDDYKNNQVSTTAVGLDAGLIWVAPRYQVGVTLANINEPSFKFGAVGTDCSSLTGDSANNCFVASDFANSGLIDATESHVMSALTTLEGAFAITPRWYLAGSYDLSKYNDPVGDTLQMASIATSYEPATWWIPGWRLGYRANLAGEKVDAVTAGLTLFSFINADVSVGLTNTEVDGDSYPRALSFNIGFEQSF